MSPEEIQRRLQKAEEEINAIKTELAVSAKSSENTEKDVAQIQGNLRWVVLGVLGAVLSTAMGYLTKGGPQ